MAKKKYYAVAAGRTTGIFTDWAMTEKQVKGFAGAKFKSFATRVAAESWLKKPVYTGKVADKKDIPQPALQQQHTATDGIVIFTDGGSINNPGPGGYGIVICEGDKRQEISGGYRLTTNNRMEMMACLVALRTIENDTRPVILYSDSSYLINGISKGWAKKWRANGWRKSDKQPALNSDLWLELLDVLEELDVTFRWVKGHAGNELNERCDKLAVASARKPNMPIDHGYEANLVSGT